MPNNWGQNLLILLARYVKMRGIRRGTPWGYSLFEFQIHGRE
jgi:hypothetical protein